MLPKVVKPKNNIYLDYAAATPLDPRVKKAMLPFLDFEFGNPSALYQQGREAKAALDMARSKIASILGCHSQEIIFTAGGTESVNLAIFGIAKNYRSGHLITSAIEHDCVLKSFDTLKSQGYKTSLVEVDSDGFINLDQLKKSVTSHTILISVMMANNEIGTIQPIMEIGKWLKGLNHERFKKGLPKIYFHTDACQAAGFLDLNVNKLGVDLMSVNGSKIYGPKQTGFLYVRKGIELKPIIYGGGQEHDLRSGTENVAGAVGLAKALELVQMDCEKENKRLMALSNYFISKIKKQMPQVLLNGPGQPVLKDLKRLPNNINLTIKNIDGEALMLYLDSYGIAASTSSACSTASAEPSHVLFAIGRSEKDAKSSIRFTMGKGTTKQHLDYVIKVLPGIVQGLRKVKQL